MPRGDSISGKGDITKDQLERLAFQYQGNEYGRYLIGMIANLK